MGYRMIQISESKKDKMAECVEKMLHMGGKLMQCIENLDDDDDEFGQREDYEPEWEDMGHRYGYGNGYSMGGGRYGGGMGMRRGVRGTGPYSRYR